MQQNQPSFRVIEIDSALGAVDELRYGLRRRAAALKDIRTPPPPVVPKKSWLASLVSRIRREKIAPVAHPLIPDVAKIAAELASLRRKDHSAAGLRRRLERLVEQGVTSLRIDSTVPLLVAVARAAKSQAPGRISVINGADADHLNLKPRSAVVVRAIAGGGSTAPDDRCVLLDANRHADGSHGWHLVGRTFATWPAQLFEKRVRRGVPLLPGSYSSGERFYLPVPPSRVDEVQAAGAQMGRRGGFYVDLSKVDLEGPISAFLPFVAQPGYRPLPVAAIPKTAWGGSLAGLLSRSSWNGIRESVFAGYGHLCQICGQKRGGQNLECHEIWDFIFDEQKEGMRIQRLAGLACLCSSCHGAMHQGFSRSMGKGDRAAYRLADINGWTMEEAEMADECVRIDVEMRSRVPWALDLTLVSGNKPLVLDGSRCEARDRLIRRRTPDGNIRSTRIYGVAYRTGARGEIVEAARV